VGAQSTRLDLDGKGFEDQGNYNAAANFGAAGALDYGVKAAGCGLTDSPMKASESCRQIKKGSRRYR